MEFEDKWAHRGNLITDNEYMQTGYPLGLKVKAEAHSYGVAYAEDIMFVTLKLRNESGAYYDEKGEFHQGMVMPDGTQLNGGVGFNYRKLFFYNFIFFVRYIIFFHLSSKFFLVVYQW